MTDSSSIPPAQLGEPLELPELHLPEKAILPLADTIARALAQEPVGSPCTNVCRLDMDTRTYCVGCHRTRAEIKSWKTLDAQDKRAIIAQLAERERARNPSDMQS
jgi:predicted Fe-S protein YdhL (DUF1289 family)